MLLSLASVKAVTELQAEESKIDATLTAQLGSNYHRRQFFQQRPLAFTATEGLAALGDLVQQQIVALI